ncbi:hypothetical protein TNCV_730321 [Trichonephila clavipes]|nr:hypothetical protein TNCV_730321 [Trichonephila clavipes]
MQNRIPFSAPQIVRTLPPPFWQSSGQVAVGNSFLGRSKRRPLCRGEERPSEDEADEFDDFALGAFLAHERDSLMLQKRVGGPFKGLLEEDVSMAGPLFRVRTMRGTIDFETPSAPS